jgi:hypothetical protein
MDFYEEHIKHIKGVGKALELAQKYANEGEWEKSKVITETIKIIQNHGI